MVSRIGSGGVAWQAPGLACATLVCLALGWTPAARADDVQLDAQGAVSTVFTLEAKSEQERCVRLKRGERIVWAFVAQGPVDFSIRTRATREVVGSSSRKDIREARDALEVPRDQDYCWAWANRKDSNVQVSMQLRRK